MRLLAAVVVTSLAACGTTEEVVPTYGEGLGTPENPIPQDSAAYMVRTRIEPADATIPPAVASVAANLRAFAQSPAQTLISLADDANVPELTLLQSALSSTLEAQLPGWIDAEIDKALTSGKTTRQLATEVAGFAETALTRFGLDSTLSFSPTKTTHTLRGLSFRLSGLDVVVPLGGLKADTIDTQPAVEVGEGGAISFGDHQFGIAFANHAWQGINLASKTVFGADVRTALATAVNCRTIAETVATKCVYSSCVGHPAQLQAVCEHGLDLIVTKLAADVGAFDLDVLRYVSGSARLVDENGDGLANRIEDGIWDPELGTARGTFTAIADGR